MAALGVSSAMMLAAPSTARAQDPADPGTGQQSASPSPARELDLAAKRPYWSGGKNRAFLSSTLELGFFYLRTQIAAGYGKPHWRWFGIEEQTRLSGAGGSDYVGLRAALPFLEVRTGARYVFPSDQALLRPRETFTRDDVRIPESPNSHYLALEGELAGSVPLPWGSLFGVGTVYYLAGVPDDWFVFEDALHVVVDPPWLWRVRLGHVLSFGKDNGLRVGFAAELIGVPNREVHVLRIGPQLTVALTHHLDAQASVMAVVASPDALRLLGAEVGQFGLRYRWATGDPFPEFP